MADDLNTDAGSLEPYGVALERIRDSIATIGRERIAIEQAQGRIAARDLVAPFQLPRIPVAIRDGFAVRAADTQPRGGRTRPLTVIGSIFADAPREPRTVIAAGQAAAITTGAPLPPGANAVLPAESASVKGNQLVAIAAVLKGSGVLFPGDEVRDGIPIVSAGRRLTPALVGLLAATGLSHIEVFQQPRIGILSTGDELLPPQEAQGGGLNWVDQGVGVREARPPSNAISLAAWCARFGLPTRRWVVGDDTRAITAALKEALADCHVILTIGGTGFSTADRVRDALEELEWTLQFEGVRLRPGRTSCFGFLRGRPTFLMPGTPTACETAFLLLALPGILLLGGSSDPPFPAVPARLGRDLRRSKEQRQWTQVVRVRLAPGTFFLQATPLAGRALQRREGRLVANATADGLVVLEETEEGLRAGDIVGVVLLHAP